MEIPFEIVWNHILPDSPDSVKLMICTVSKRYEEKKSDLKFNSYYPLENYTHSFKIKNAVCQHPRNLLLFKHPENITSMITTCTGDFSRFINLRKLVILRASEREIKIPKTVRRVKVETESFLKIVFESKIVSDLVVENSKVEVEGLEEIGKLVLLKNSMIVGIKNVLVNSLEK